MLRRRAFVGGALGLAGCGIVRGVDRRRSVRARRRGYESVVVESGPDRVHARVHPGPPFAERARPLVFVHGFGGTALFQWDRQMELFSRFRSVIVPDLLWFGDSTSRDDDPTLAHQARALEAVLDRIEAETVDLVGLSYGGFVALELARRRPERVGNLVLVDSPGPAWSRERHAKMLASFGASSAADLFVPETAADVNVLVDLAVSDPPCVPAFAARQVIETYYDPHRAQLRGLLHHLEQTMDEQLAQPLPQRFRSLVIWGEDDPVFELAVGEALSRTLGGPLVALPGARHLSSADAPVEFNRALLTFLLELEM